MGQPSGLRVNKVRPPLFGTIAEWTLSVTYKTRIALRHVNVEHVEHWGTAKVRQQRLVHSFD